MKTKYPNVKKNSLHKKTLKSLHFNFFNYFSFQRKINKKGYFMVKITATRFTNSTWYWQLDHILIELVFISIKGPNVWCYMPLGFKKKLMLKIFNVLISQCFYYVIRIFQIFWNIEYLKSLQCACVAFIPTFTPLHKILKLAMFFSILS
jgi:hypothetical protein